MCYYKVKASVGYTGRAEIGEGRGTEEEGGKRERREIKHLKNKDPDPESALDCLRSFLILSKLQF